jgi:hypothetical protein
MWRNSHTGGTRHTHSDRGAAGDSQQRLYVCMAFGWPATPASMHAPQASVTCAA